MAHDVAHNAVCSWVAHVKEVAGLRVADPAELAWVLKGGVPLDN
jgi:hypothetical protein